MGSHTHHQRAPEERVGRGGKSDEAPYDPQRRRLQNLTVNSGGNTIMDNAYTYDAVSNVLSVVNGASVPQSGKAGGQMAHTYLLCFV